MARKIRCNDEVIVLTGKDKGKRGKVQCVLSSSKVIVSGINMIKKHQKSMPTNKRIGGIIEKEAAIDVSNIAIFNPSLCKADRIGFLIQNGKKFRVLKSTGEVLE